MSSDGGLSLKAKMNLLVDLAKIMNELHNLATPMAHGSITSHNIFLDFEVGRDQPKVRISELEMNDFKRYANMFYNYRSTSVWSAPECLK